MGRACVAEVPSGTKTFLRTDHVVQGGNNGVIQIGCGGSMSIRALFVRMGTRRSARGRVLERLSSVKCLARSGSGRGIVLVILGLHSRINTIAPILRIVGGCRVGIACVDSRRANAPCRCFGVNLLVRGPSRVGDLLRSVSGVYRIGVVSCSVARGDLSGAIFCVAFTGRVHRVLGLSRKRAGRIVVGSGGVVRVLSRESRLPLGAFSCVGRFTEFIMSRGKSGFATSVGMGRLSKNVAICLVRPPYNDGACVVGDKGRLLFISYNFPYCGGRVVGVFARLLKSLSGCQGDVIVARTSVSRVNLLRVFSAICVDNDYCRGFLTRHGNVPGFERRGALRRPCYGLDGVVSSCALPGLRRYVIMNGETSSRLLSHVNDVSFNNLSFAICRNYNNRMGNRAMVIYKRLGFLFAKSVFMGTGNFSRGRGRFGLLTPCLVADMGISSIGTGGLHKCVTRECTKFATCPKRKARVILWWPWV